MLQVLCLLLSVSTQVSAPKAAGFLPEAQQWVREHAGEWERGNYLAQRLRTSQSVVLVVPVQPGASALTAARCFEALLERSEPLCIGVPHGWEDVRALDSWLTEGKGSPGMLLEKGLLDLARAWNADEKHARKLRAAGIDYRATRDAALGLTEFVRRIDPLLEHRAEQVLAPFRQLGADGRCRYEKVDSNGRFVVQAFLEELDGQVPEFREQWQQTLGAAVVAAGVRNLRRIQQAEQEISKPTEFRRGRALCVNAAAARDELARETGLVALVPNDAQLEAQEARAVLGEGALVLLILAPGEAPDFVALSGVRASGALDLRELPKEGPVATWFAAHLGKRADLVLWASSR